MKYSQEEKINFIQILKEGKKKLRVDDTLSHLGIDNQTIWVEDISRIGNNE